jgi:hypothetical protein
MSSDIVALLATDAEALK